MIAAVVVLVVGLLAWVFFMLAEGLFEELHADGKDARGTGAAPNGGEES